MTEDPVAAAMDNLLRLVHLYADTKSSASYGHVVEAAKRLARAARQDALERARRA